MAEIAQDRLPPGYPTQLSGPLAWTGSTLESENERIYIQLSEDDVHHIDRALQHFKGVFLLKLYDLIAKAYRGVRLGHRPRFRKPGDISTP